MKTKKSFFWIITLMVLILPIKVKAQPSFNLVCDTAGQLLVGSNFSCHVDVTMGSEDTLALVELEFTPNSTVSLNSRTAGTNWTLSNTSGNVYTFMRDNEYISNSGTVATFSFTTMQTPGEVQIKVTGVRYEVCETAGCQDINPNIPPLVSTPIDNPKTGIVNPLNIFILGVCLAGIVFYIVKKNDLFQQI